MKTIPHFLVGAGLLALSIPSHAAYVIAGNNLSAGSTSSGWAWDGNQHVEFRQALENTSNFGPGGTVTQAISTLDLGTNINTTSLQGVDLFISSWWHESSSAMYQASLLHFFFNGGDLMLFQDSSDRDGLGAALGFATTNTNISQQTAFNTIIANGPFGPAAPISTAGHSGKLDGFDVMLAGGTICGVGRNGDITMACWDDGVLAPGSGSLTIATDIDLISGLFGGANFNPLNDKGRIALNIVDFHIDPVVVPVPAAIWLFGSGLAGLVAVSRRRTWC